MVAAASVPLTSAQNWCLVGVTAGSLVVCAAFTAVRAARLGVFSRKDTGGKAGPAVTPRMSGRMGQGQWDFSTSFATNIAVIGSVLTLILNSGIFQTASTSILPSDAYSGLGILFGSVAIVAPLLYNGTATKVNANVAGRDTAAEYHGTVWGFFLAAVATQWALVGSVITVFLTLLELLDDHSLSLTPVVLLAVTLTAGIGFFARYSWVKMGGTVEDQYDPAQPPVAPPPAASLAHDATYADASIASTADGQRGRGYPPPWSLL